MLIFQRRAPRLAQLLSNPFTTWPKKNWDNRALCSTVACSLEHARACSLACVAVSIFLARVAKCKTILTWMLLIWLFGWFLKKKERERERERDYVVSTSPYRIWLQVQRRVCVSTIEDYTGNKASQCHSKGDGGLLGPDWIIQHMVSTWSWDSAENL